jgi:molybdopterin synthase catalytic subunit
MSATVPTTPVEPFDIRLSNFPLDVAAAVEAVSTPAAGAIDLFLGVTRAERLPDTGAKAPAAGAGDGRGGGSELMALEYHAYPEMAMSEMRKLAVRAAEQWPILRVVLWHRLGAVPVGAASVIIAVSCPHRGEAFAACQFLIDELKKSVPLWKKELYTRETRWQNAS